MNKQHYKTKTYAITAKDLENTIVKTGELTVRIVNNGYHINLITSLNASDIIYSYLYGCSKYYECDIIDKYGNSIFK